MSTTISRDAALSSASSVPPAAPSLAPDVAACIKGIVERVGTPFYVYDGGAVTQRVRAVREFLGAETALYYSIKANPSLGLCQLISREGVGAEVASLGELALAERAGFSPAHTLFAGPGKTDLELDRAARMGIRSVNVESVGEMRRLDRIGSELGKVLPVALRINPAMPVKGAHMRMGGGPQQFGIDEEMMPEVLDLAAGLPYLRIIGLHVYTGTQLFDVEALLGHMRHVLDIGRQMASHLRQPLDLIDLGGGFGVPYADNQRDFDLPAFAEGYRLLVRSCQADSLLREAHLAIELGRYLVAQAGVYVTRVVDVKKSRGKTFVIADGGMNHHMAATGNFGQVFKRAYPIALLNTNGHAPLSELSVAGPCCTPMDVFGHDLKLPLPAVGDLLGVFCSGAYGYSASTLGFLSHPAPAEVLVHRGGFQVLREPGNPEQVLKGQYSLES